MDATCNVNSYSCEVFSSEIKKDRQFNELELEVSDAFQVQSVYTSVNCEDSISDKDLMKAANEILKCEANTCNDETSEVNTRVVNYVLNNTTRAVDGRLIMPLPWKGGVIEKLAKNYHLSLKILKSSVKKITKVPGRLEMMNKVFVDQVDAGIIERVYDLDNFIKDNDNYNFLAHMGVFKMSSTTTKCRVVFLSNLCEVPSNQAAYSHNQAMHSGPCLNQKITTALLHLRFGEKLITYDVKKAFNQISLYPDDANRLLFMWFKDPCKGDFTPVAYRNIRLSFGLRASPCILMLALYKILCVDTEGDDDRTIQFKRLLYALLYMDNGAYTGSTEEVKWAYSKLNETFNKYQIFLQEITSNEASIQTEFDKSTGETTPDVVKLLGLKWDRMKDQLVVPPITLDVTANTKRKVLQTIASQYDVFNYRGPIFNRARLFLHGLQCDTSLSWDANLSHDQLAEWRRIVKQANSAPSVTVDRFVGDRDDSYELIGFTDASNSIYACVIYIKNVRTKKVSFLQGKHRIVNKKFALKTIPSLELQALTLGVESIIHIKNELCGVSCVIPINIVSMRLYSDSMICLQWVNNYIHKLEKMKQSIFVMNRLDCILNACTAENKITFSFVPTNSNTADCLSRAISHKTMIKFKYIDGPEFLSEDILDSVFDVVVPNPNVAVFDNVGMFSSICDTSGPTHLIDLDRFSKFYKYSNTYYRVLLFIEILKAKVAHSKGKTYDVPSDQELVVKSVKLIIAKEQMTHYSDVYRYLESPSRILKEIPPLITKMNVFLDRDGLLKVKSKFDRFADDFQFPILLPANSILTTLLIRDVHQELAHIGCYHLINHLRKEFYIERIFSTVNKILKKCVICQRMNGRTVKINQSSYRSFRSDPPCVPYRYIYLDYMGPFYVRLMGKRVKVWLLVFTCLWSRGVNIKVCDNLSVATFLKSFQSHVYDEGLPSKIFSDLGSQITSGGKTIQNFLSNVDTCSYLNENGIERVKFEHYFKGDSSLGSIVEICVKFIKRLLYGAIKNSVLNRDDFDLLIDKTKYLLNSRPVAYKNLLSNNEPLDIPEPISPELLNKGRTLTCVNIIPALAPRTTDDPNWGQIDAGTDGMLVQFSKLQKVQERVIDLYNKEFMATLLQQGLDKKGRYQPVKHESLQINDIVLLKEPLLKFHQYPMAVVHKIHKNYLGEVTDVEVFKGKSRELVQRHITVVVPYLRSDTGSLGSVLNPNSSPEEDDPAPVSQPRRKGRIAAANSRTKTAAMLNND